MIRVGFLLNYDHQSWLGGFNVIINLFRSINLIKKKRLIPILIVPNYFKKYYKKYNIPRDQIIFTNLFTEQKLSSKLTNKIKIFLFGKSQIYDDFLKKKKISIISHGLFFGLGAKSEIKSVSWIPDFQHLHFPQYFTAKNRLFKYLNTLISIKTSNSTILSSYDAKKDLETVLSKKFYKGIVHPYVFDLPKKKNLLKYSKLKKKYDIPKKYFYIPNQFWKHKNHEIIIETLRFLQKKKRESKYYINRLSL